MHTTTKVAFATRNGQTITQHFGRLKAFVVAEIKDGVVTNRTQVARSEYADKANGHGHNHDALLEPVSNCETLIAGGMGFPMAEHVKSSGLNLVLTSVRDIDSALTQLMAGTLQHEPGLAHHPGHN
jgi:predicted Fe-Mo cluster-binding NifX family protein